mmetsp:Transcript_4355/g.5024  ORF Transcript_4355/g.5024 Transcript_4355/m.5024 type:complete len:87 (-) Transcript_4355:164-424(-)
MTPTKTNNSSERYSRAAQLQAKSNGVSATNTIGDRYQMLVGQSRDKNEITNRYSQVAEIQREKKVTTTSISERYHQAALLQKQNEK